MNSTDQGQTPLNVILDDMEERANAPHFDFRTDCRCPGCLAVTDRQRLVKALRVAITFMDTGADDVIDDITAILNGEDKQDSGLKEASDLGEHGAAG